MELIVKDSARVKLTKNSDMKKVLNAVRKDDSNTLAKFGVIVKRVANVLVLL